MAVLTIEGTVENGKIRLFDSVTLPEHTRVHVVIPSVATVEQARVHSPRLRHPEQAADFAKQVVEVSRWSAAAMVGASAVMSAAVR
jgi:hypothetical protein